MALSVGWRWGDRRPAGLTCRLFTLRVAVIRVPALRVIEFHAPGVASGREAAGAAGAARPRRPLADT